MFSRQGALALDQMRISGHLDEPRAVQEWMKQVSGNVEGLRVLTGDSLYADADLCQARVAQGKDYLVKLKKPAEALPGRGVALCRGWGTGADGGGQGPRPAGTPTGMADRYGCQGKGPDTRVFPVCHQW